VLTNLMPAGIEYYRLLPEIVLTLVATLIMFLEAVFSEEQKKIFPTITIVGLFAGLWMTYMAYGQAGPAFNQMMIVDGFATFFRVLVMIVGLITVFSSTDYLRRESQNGGEYYALLLFSIVGQSLMAAANELIMIFIGLEISSIASYILAGYLRDDKRNNESALKYFLLGSFATAFMLYGVAWIYGATGSTNLADIRRALTAPVPPAMGMVGTACALIFGRTRRRNADVLGNWLQRIIKDADEHQRREDAGERCLARGEMPMVAQEQRKEGSPSPLLPAWPSSSMSV